MRESCTADMERCKRAEADSIIREERGEFTRAIQINPGYDHRNFSQDRGDCRHGQHGMDMRFALIGEKGAVVFAMFLSDLIPGQVGAIGNVDGKRGIMAADLGYHWTTKKHEYVYSSKGCPWVEGECHYDGSGLAATQALEVLTADGLPGLWALLEERYVGWDEYREEE